MRPRRDPQCEEVCTKTVAKCTKPAFSKKINAPAGHIWHLFFTKMQNPLPRKWSNRLCHDVWRLDLLRLDVHGWTSELDIFFHVIFFHVKNSASKSLHLDADASRLWSFAPPGSGTSLDFAQDRLYPLRDSMIQR